MKQWLQWRWSERFELRRRDQATVAFVSLCLATIWLASWSLRGGFRGDLVAWRASPEPSQVSFVVDVNRAEWSELTLLPRIGETLAKRIVASRREHGPFQTVDQLQRVKGIGPRTVDLIRRYVIVDPADPRDAGPLDDARINKRGE